MEGQRVAKKKRKKKGKKTPLIATVAVAAVACAYLGLCAWVGASDLVMPNVFVAGIDASGMTTDQVRQAVAQAKETYGGAASVTLRYGNWSGTLSCSDFVTTGTSSELKAVQTGREHFLTNGYQYIRHLLGGSSQVALDETVNADQPALEELLDQAEEEIGGGVTQISYQVEGTNLSVTKGSTGRTFDRERILFLASGGVSEALAETIAQQTGTDEEIDLNGQDVITEVAPDEPDFEAIRADVYREPKNAEMDSDHNVTDHVVGLDFDVETLKQAYDAAAEGETFTIPLTVTQPAETKESFESKLFRDVLGEGTTTVGGSANRKSNVKLSASACNGVILLPGEEFSYNNTTGSRTADKGYLEAPVYSGGASVDEVGGGICQTSSTIYYAVLHTTLKVVERAAHRYNTGYVDAGMDATVYYGSTDFRFKNNTNYPIKIVTQSYDQGGKRKLTVKIYGTNEDGSYAIPRSTTYDTVTPTTEYQADTSVPRGTTVVETKQNPYTGVKAQTYRDIYDKNGNLIETQDMGISSYKMRPKIIYYNPADGDPSTWVNGKPPQTTAETQTTDSTQASDTTASAEQTDVSAAGVVSSGDNDLPVLLDTSSFSNVT